MNTYNINEIQNSLTFANNVYLDKNFLVLIPECQLTEKIKKLLIDWEFNFIYSESEHINKENLEEQQKEQLTEKNRLDMVKEKIASAEKQKRQKELMARTEETFVQFLHFVEKTFHKYSLKKILDQSMVSDTVKYLCIFVKENKKYILRINTEKYINKEEYLVMHSLRSTIFAIIIGLQLKMPTHRLIELGTACILHEIGMLKLPPQYYLSEAPLNEQGKKALFTHPVLTYNILKEVSFSRPICLGCLEHHERENGMGYPRGLTKDRISIYGKIIAVACSYEAATGYRPYKEAHAPSTGLADLLKNEGKKYDDRILRALLFSLSFYPVGSYVHLSDGRIGQVIDINPYDPRFPIVQLHEIGDESDETKIIGTTSDGVKINRPLTKEEIKQLLNSKD